MVIVGSSYLVGYPLFILFQKLGGKSTICHKHTKNLESFTKKADIVVVATGV